VGRFVTGAKIPYRGRQMRLTVERFEKSLVDVSYRGGFLVRVPEQIPEPSRDLVIETAIRLWLRKRLREDVAAYARAHGERNGTKPKSILIKDQKHLWGSCGNDRKIHLNWHLIFAPKPVLEYAVVHELCHLRERNHDRAFWVLVGSILPDWEARKAWLDENEHVLGWRRIEPARQSELGLS
jgi:predicted metal-dependent hydrolase